MQAIVDMYHLDDIDKKILKFKVRYPQASAEDVAAHVEITEANLSERTNKPAFKVAWDEYNIPLEGLIKKSATKALRVLNSIMDDTALDAKTRVMACKVVMDVITGPKSIVLTSIDTSQPTDTLYKTTVAPDGSLIQEIIDIEIGETQQIQGSKDADLVETEAVQGRTEGSD